MLNHWDLNRSKVLIVKSTLFLLRPCQGELVDFEDMNYKLEFFGPQKAVRVEVQLVEAFLCEAFARCEVGRMSW